MKLFRIVFLVLFASSIQYEAASKFRSPSFAPISTITTLGISEDEVSSFVSEVFIKGDCANVGNVKNIGHIRGIGLFRGGELSLGMEEGLLLATGDIVNSHGPNVSESRTTQWKDTVQDADLAGLATSKLFDNVGIEFDFTPQKEFVSFSYVFASEEYCEYVGSEFNDVFGFFVSGPGINGPFDNNAINVALIPETNEFVAINNVNHLKNQDFYVPNELEDDAVQCRKDFEPQYADNIEYDGFTRKLRAVFRVVPCATYHIRLVVGDVGDAELDSAVFLEAKSFDLRPEVRVEFEASNSANSDVMIEGCVDGVVKFIRTDEDKFEEDLPFSFIYTPLTKAEDGVDFSSIPTEIIIPASETAISIPVEAFLDNLPEGEEPIGVEVDIPCACSPRNNVLFSIKDTAPLELLEDTLSSCLGEPFLVDPIIANGNPPYEYRWDDGTSSDFFFIDSLLESSSYSVTITDLCGQVASASYFVQATQAATVQYTGSQSLCEGMAFDLPLELTGTAPWDIEYMINNTRFQTDSITSSPFIISLIASDTLEVLSISDASCMGQSNVLINYELEGPLASPQITPLSCPEINNAAIELNVISNRSFEVAWNKSVNNSTNPTQLGAGLYQYTITDANNCQFIDEILIEEVDEATALRNDCGNIKLSKNIFIPTAFSPNRDGFNDEFRIYANPNINAKVAYFRIFDRWGNLLFEAEDFDPIDPDRAWNGKVNGQLLAAGIYVYHIMIQSSNGKEEAFMGDFSLIR